MFKAMLKQLRQLLLKSDLVRRAVADYQKRMKDQRRQDHLVSVIFRSGSARLQCGQAIEGR